MYDDPVGVIAGSVVMWLVTIVCIALRFALKIRERQPFYASDWLILVAWTFGTGLTDLEIYGVAIKSLGYSIGATLVDPASVTGQLNKAKHIQLAFLLLGVAALGLIKLSVCCLYWQLFAQVTLRRFLIAWMVIIAAWATAFTMAGLLECGTHLTAVFGTPTEYLEHCGGAVTSGYVMVGTDIVTDFITLVIPIPVIMKLHMDMHRKLLTLSVFLIGALSVGASIAKGYIYVRSSLGQYTEDGLIVLTGLSIWNLVEVEVGIVAACGPLLRSIISRAFTIPSILSSRWRSTLKIIDSKESQVSQRFREVSNGEVELAMPDRSISQVSSERKQLGQCEIGSRFNNPQVNFEDEDGYSEPY